MKELEDIFKIKISDSKIFQSALTHPSYIQENNLEYIDCYERLEFLGDAVLKLVTSDILFNMYPESTEGELSKIRSIIVSDSTLAKIAKDNGLCDLIIISAHDRKQGLAKLDSVCACAFEAVLGAYYLDGKVDDIKKYIQSAIKPYIIDVKDNFLKYNAKEILQEYTQSKTKTRPEYRVISESGPAHKKVFEVEVSYEGEVLAAEKGLSKKDAEQKAAFCACKKLGIER